MHMRNVWADSVRFQTEHRPVVVVVLVVVVVKGGGGYGYLRDYVGSTRNRMCNAESATVSEMCNVLEPCHLQPDCPNGVVLPAGGSNVGAGGGEGGGGGYADITTLEKMESNGLCVI